MFLNMKNKEFILSILLCFQGVYGEFAFATDDEVEEQRIGLIVDIIKLNLKTNGWETVFILGRFPDIFYSKIKSLPFAFVIASSDREEEDVDEVTPHHSNTIIMSASDFDEYEENMKKAINSPYWHPHANLLLYYHGRDTEFIPKIFFSFWYYKAINAIIVHYDDAIISLLVFYYNPYISENYKLHHSFGCWTARKIGMPVLGFNESFVCVEGCQNVTILSKLRANNLGTCMGFSVIEILYTEHDVGKFKLFEDKSNNLHGFSLRAFTTEVFPFLSITDNGNGTYTLGGRDGILWNTLSDVMNFTIDLSPSVKIMKQPFNFEVNIGQIFNFAFRKADIYLIPIYLFDVIVVEIDTTFPFVQSGVCIMAHRADFQTSIFGIKVVQSNYMHMLQLLLCFLAIWIMFIIYNAMEMGYLSLDQIGKDLTNAFRNILLITLFKPPKRQSFRIFLTVSIWGFFIINFISQATIISFFTALKRGREIETFEDIIEKGFKIKGMASPDLILPDTEERFRKINSKLVPIMDMYLCVRQLQNDSQQFCLVDCSVGRLAVKNNLDRKGEQYLHIARDKIHSHYLNIIQSKHSPFTDQFNKYLMTFVESGLVRKWEKIKSLSDVKDEIPLKRLGMDNLGGFFRFYLLYVCFNIVIFFIEIMFHSKNFRKLCRHKK